MILSTVIRANISNQKLILFFVKIQTDASKFSTYCYFQEIIIFTPSQFSPIVTNKCPVFILQIMSYLQKKKAYVKIMSVSQSVT
jgi:hypothetical protein